MAGMPRWPEEPPLSRARTGLLFLLLLFSAHPLRAQESVLGGVLEISARASSMHRGTRLLLGAAGLLELGNSWRAGGGGHFFTSGADLNNQPPLPSTELHVGYGGFVLERTFRPPLDSTSSFTQRFTLRGRVLIGMGNGNVRDAVTRVRYLSDNFFVAEPAIQLALPLFEQMEGVVLFGYRIALGVNDLDSVDAGSIRGWSLGIALQAGPF